MNIINAVRNIQKIHQGINIEHPRRKYLTKDRDVRPNRRPSEQNEEKMTVVVVINVAWPRMTSSNGSAE